MGYTIIKNGNQYSILENGKYGYNKQYVSNRDMNLLGTDIRAGDFFKVVKNNDGSKRALLTRKVNPRLDVVETTPEFEKAFKFTLDYLNSEGFNERFNKLKLPDNVSEVEKLPVKKPRLLIDHYYLKTDAGDGTLSVADYDLNRNIVSSKAFTPLLVIPHELGHWLDNLFLPDRKWAIDSAIHGNRNVRSYTYSSLWPELRDNIYNTVYNYKNIGPMSSRKQKELYVHDARPEELYANLVMFRKFLKDNNIYDSFKAKNPFKQEHLNKVKLLPNIPERVLNFINLYDDNNLIKAMNTVAYNPTKQTNINLLYYV